MASQMVAVAIGECRRKVSAVGRGKTLSSPRTGDSTKKDTVPGTVKTDAPQVAWASTRWFQAVRPFSSGPCQPESGQVGPFQVGSQGGDKPGTDRPTPSIPFPISTTRQQYAAAFYVKASEGNETTGGNNSRPGGAAVIILIPKGQHYRIFFSSMFLERQWQVCRLLVETDAEAGAIPWRSRARDERGILFPASLS